MNYSVFLEQKLDHLEAKPGVREVIISCDQSESAERGDLELVATQASESTIELTVDQYRIVSVRSGRARVRVWVAETELAPHHHLEFRRR